MKMISPKENKRAIQKTHMSLTGKRLGKPEVEDRQKRFEESVKRNRRNAKRRGI